MYYKTKPCNKATASKVSACKKTRSAAMVMDPEYENNSHEDEETFLSDCFPSLEDTTAFYSTSTAASATAAFPAAATLNKQAVAATGATSNTAPRSTSPSLPTTKLTKTTSIDPMTPLLPTFVPGEYDVICGRGAKAKHHIGNINFRKHLQQCISEYKQADTKLDKTLVVSDIVEWVRSKSPNGGFVKQVPNNDNGAWFEVGDQLAREKVGQGLRDLLHSQYKSSTKAKWRRRRVEITSEFDSIIQSNQQVCLRTKQLADTVQYIRQQEKKYSKLQHQNDAIPSSFNEKIQTSDEDMMKLFTAANVDILSAIKKTDYSKQAMMEFQQQQQHSQQRQHQEPGIGLAVDFDKTDDSDCDMEDGSGCGDGVEEKEV